MSEQPQGIVTENENNVSLVDQIWSALEQSKGRDRISPTLRSEQRKILDKLPTNLETEIRAFATYAELKMQEPLQNLLAGEMFEQLVRADANICPEDETPEAKLIRSVMKDPALYRLDEYGITESVKQPDIDQVNQKGQIVGAVEVKATQIDQRSSDQIGSFKKNTVHVVNTLQKIKESDKQVLESHGLKQIADNPNRLEVSDNFSVTLAVPRGAYNGVPGLLIEETGFESNDDVEEAVERLENCKIMESKFSRDELGVITSCVGAWLKTRSF